MKKIIFAFCCLVSYLVLPSCEDMMGDFLEKAPGVDVTEDTIFSSKPEVEKFVAGTYERGLHSTIPLRNGYNSDFLMTSAYCDEAEANEGWYDSQQWNQGNVTDGGSYEDTRVNVRWDAIRRCNTLMERIDGVPGLEQAYIDQVKGEARFIRALNYFEMVKRYGGVPIINKRVKVGETVKIGRATLDETVKFIVGDCDTASTLIPENYPSAFRGRITKTAVLALKSRTLLYAASPIFNTGTPHLDFGANNNLICYGNFDNNRWKLAADAAKAALDAAPAGNFSLVTNQGVTKNYQYVWEKNDNSELILENKTAGASGFWSWPSNMTVPKAMGVSWGGYSATHNFVKMYEKKDGTPMVWGNSGNGLLAIYNNLDPRFLQSMAPVGSKWSNTLGTVESWEGGKHENKTGGVGVWIHKGANYDASWSVKPVYINVLFRVAELYLNYAEALNEAEGPVQAAYDAVNEIRARSGMPNLPAGLTKDQFRLRIRNERAIELFHENQRFWDVRRWKIAEDDGVMKGKMYGVITRKIAGNEFSYEVYKFEDRIFHKKMYLHPFLRSEVLKGYLIQNPGY